jgi:hypothetical protein
MAEGEHGEERGKVILMDFVIFQRDLVSTDNSTVSDGANSGEKGTTQKEAST